MAVDNVIGAPESLEAVWQHWLPDAVSHTQLNKQPCRYASHRDGDTAEEKEKWTSVSYITATAIMIEGGEKVGLALVLNQVNTVASKVKLENVAKQQDPNGPKTRCVSTPPSAVK